MTPYSTPYGVPVLRLRVLGVWKESRKNAIPMQKVRIQNCCRGYHNRFASDGDFDDDTEGVQGLLPIDAYQRSGEARRYQYDLNIPLRDLILF
jgi:hypothetical protein